VKVQAPSRASGKKVSKWEDSLVERKKEIGVIGRGEAFLKEGSRPEMVFLGWGGV